MQAPFKAPTFQPLYRQIKDLLMERISSGEWSPGTFIPSETALATTYGVSVGTLRKALNELMAENVVVRQQGKGTSVATHDADHALFRFFNICRPDGERSMPVSIVLERRLRKASAAEAAELGIPAGGKVVHIARVRELEGKPAIYEDILVCAERFLGLEKQPEVLPNTLYHLYQQRYGMTVAHADERIVAICANDQQATSLGVAVGTPLLQISRLARDYQGRPVEKRLSMVSTQAHCYSNSI
ncbi:MULTISPECIES: GntR family transcriptional regulator [unclassified Pseudomonas]|uniref:GntR family transcriptional regulator n=1 Tax=unclassified Pseudomonas TaxID=196821 RepID=UPI0025F54B9F|nr:MULTISPECIES: GntR family transcriptional regulator [unclassified Pseudomonas]